MPVIEVLGLVEKVGDHEDCLEGKWVHRLDKVDQAIRRAVSGIDELKISPDVVSVYFPRSYASPANNVVTVKIEGVYKRPERTEKVLLELTQRVAIEVAEFVRKSRLGPVYVEAFIASRIIEDLCVHCQVDMEVE